jgi:hypothetical protein
VANPNKFGLVIGALFVGWHLLWSLLVLAGWAQSILDFIFLGAHDPAGLRRQTI